MGWFSSDGNSGFYRDFGSGNLDFRRRGPYSFCIEMATRVAHRSPALEWKVPIAVNNQVDSRGAMYGPMIQDAATWEEFSWTSTPSWTVEFGHGDPRNAGHATKAARSYRVVGVNGITGPSNSGNQYVLVGCPGWHQFCFRGARQAGALSIGDMTNLSIGYSRSVFTWANGASSTIQPMRIGTTFEKAAFYSRELPDSVADDLVRGRHPMDIPGYLPDEFYPLNDPGEINEQKPRCIRTGNTLSVYGAAMTWDDAAGRLTGAYAQYSPPQANWLSTVLGGYSEEELALMMLDASGGGGPVGSVKQQGFGIAAGRDILQLGYRGPR